MGQQETPVNNSPFSEEELNHFEDRLKEEKEEAQQKIQNFKDHLEDLEDKLADTTSSSAHHQGNIASSEEEREKYYAMIEKQKDKISEIHVALDKISAGTYGICDVTGDPIDKERLEIKPHARYSVDAVKSSNELGSENMKVQDPA